MPSEEHIKAAINTYINAFAKKDLEAILDLYADDAWVEDPVGTERKVGKEALRAFYKVSVDMDITGALESEIRVAGNEAAFAFSIDIQTPDGVLTIKPIDVMTFNDEGKVTSMRAFFGPGNQSMKQG